ncbi:MAG: Ycf51 family protein [Cyanobacteria bacterium P01_H01_bin.121]
MLSSSELLELSKWAGIATLGMIALTLLAFALQWGIRFRLVGVSGFFLVLVAGSFGLSLGLYERVNLDGALPYTTVYDTGGTRVVLKIPTELETEVDAAAVETTLREAAFNLFSSGRYGQLGENKLLIKLRTVSHPAPGISEPLYLGSVKRSLSLRNDPDLEIVVNNDQLAGLVSNTSSNAETSTASTKS